MNTTKNQLGQTTTASQYASATASDAASAFETTFLRQRQAPYASDNPLKSDIGRIMSDCQIMSAIGTCQIKP